MARSDRRTDRVYGPPTFSDHIQRRRRRSALVGAADGVFSVDDLWAEEVPEVLTKLEGLRVALWSRMAARPGDVSAKSAAEEAANSAPPDRLLRTPEVCERVGVGRTTLWRWEAEERFPRRRQVGGNVVGYLESEVNAWIASRPEAA